MLKTELLKNGALIKTISDIGMMLLQLDTGVLYEEAIDPVSANRQYKETKIPIGLELEEPEEKAE